MSRGICSAGGGGGGGEGEDKGRAGECGVLRTARLAMMDLRGSPLSGRPGRAVRHYYHNWQMVSFEREP